MLALPVDNYLTATSRILPVSSHGINRSLSDADKLAENMFLFMCVFVERVSSASAHPCDAPVDN